MNLSTRAIQAELKNKTAQHSEHQDYKNLIDQYSQLVVLGVQSMSSAISYINRICKHPFWGKI